MTRHRLSILLVAKSFAFQPVFALAQTPNDSKYGQQWYLEQVDAPTAWDTGTGSDDVIVAVLDTGVDLDHPDLKGNIWVNDDEESGNNVDDDDNGFVDDVYGWDFVQDDNAPVPSANGSEAAVSHGTLIAGLIGAKGNNAAGVAGVMWDVQIMSVRMLNASGSGDAVTAAKAVDYAVANGADVINLSFAGDNADKVLRTAIQRAYNAGVVVVAAMGNEGRDTDSVAVYPACLRDGDHDWVIGVASSDKRDEPSTFSNYGSTCTDLAAPGEDIYGLSYENKAQGFTSAYGGLWSGTSMASPLVAGAAALLRSAFPLLSVDNVRNAIKLSVDPLTGLTASQKAKYGAGRLNVAEALVIAATYASTTEAEEEVIEVAPETSETDSETTPLPNYPATNSIVLGASAGQSPIVTVANTDGTTTTSFLAYGASFMGGVNVAVGDVDGDGDEDVVTGPGNGGGPHVRAFTEDGALLGQFFPYATTSRGGSNVAVGDVDGDGTDEIITAVGEGVSQDIVAWTLGGVEKLRFTASAFAASTSLRVAAGDVTGDGKDEIIVSSGAGAAPKVAIYSSTGVYLLEFAPYATSFMGGVFVTTGDVDGNGTDEIITGTGDGGGPHVRIFTKIGAVVGSFFAFAETARHGVRVASVDVDGDGKAEIIVTSAIDSLMVRVLTASGTEVASW